MTGPWRPDDVYEVGGGRWHYGQDVSPNLLEAMIGGVEAPSDGSTPLGPLERGLYQLPLPVLAMFKPFTWGTTDADWEDQDRAVQAIVKSFRPKTLQGLAEWLRTTFEPWKTAIEAKQAQREADWQHWLTTVYLPWKTEVEEKAEQRRKEFQDWLDKTFGPWKAAQEARADAWKEWVDATFGPWKAIQDAREVQWQEWLRDIFTPLKDAQEANRKKFDDWLRDTFATFSALQDAREKAWQDWIAKTFNPWKAAADANKAKWDDWLATTFPAFSAAQDAREKAYQDWLAATFGPFKAAQDAREAAFQKWINDIFNPVKGEVIGNSNGLATINTAFQEWLDGMLGLNGTTGSKTPIKDAIAAILGIQSASDAAQAAADRANMGVERLEALQNAGGFDDFDWPLADTLPNTAWSVFNPSGAVKWGPDGNGYLVYKKLSGTGSIRYRSVVKPATKPQGKVSAVLSKAPAPNVAGAYFELWCHEPAPGATVVSAVGVRVNQIGGLDVTKGASVQFLNTSATGAVTNLGSAKTIHRLLDGDSLQLRWDDTLRTLEFWRNDIMVHTVSGVTMPPGQYVGFGMAMVTFVSLTHPGVELKGVAWH